MTELEIQRTKEKIARTLWGDAISIQLPLEKTTRYVTSFSLISATTKQQMNTTLIAKTMIA